MPRKRHLRRELKLLDYLFHYSYLFPPAFYLRLIELVADRKGIPLTEELRQLKLTLWRVYSSKKARKKVLKEAIKVLGAEEVAGEAFAEMRELYNRIVDETYNALSELGTREAKEVLKEVLETADDIRIVVHFKNINRSAMYTLDEVRRGLHRQYDLAHDLHVQYLGVFSKWST